MLKNTEKDFKNVTLIEFKFDITNLKIKYVKDHSCSTYANFSEKLTFLPPDTNT